MLGVFGQLGVPLGEADDGERAWRLILDRQPTVAVLDSGFSTLDLLVIKQGRIEKRFTGGDTLGVRRAAEDIIQAVKTQHGFTMSPAEADGYIRSYIERKKASHSH